MFVEPAGEWANCRIPSYVQIYRTTGINCLRLGPWNRPWDLDYHLSGFFRECSQKEPEGEWEKQNRTGEEAGKDVSSSEVSPQPDPTGSFGGFVPMCQSLAVSYPSGKGVNFQETWNEAWRQSSWERCELLAANSQQLGDGFTSPVKVFWATMSEMKRYISRKNTELRRKESNTRRNGEPRNLWTSGYIWTLL